jgi:serine/threonine protein kinase
MEVMGLSTKFAKSVNLILYRLLRIYAKCKLNIESKKIYVIKEIDTHGMSDSQGLDALEEINILGRVDSPYIVKYYDSFVQDNTKINIIMEFCEHGDLHSYLKKLNGKHLSENAVWKFFIQISLGVHHLHS